MRGIFNNLLNKKFGRSVVLRRGADDKSGNTMWILRCSCGSVRTVQSGHLNSSRDKPCRKCASAQSGERYIYNGVDRMNNSLGYINKNCVSCCKICNYMKLEMSISEFLDKCATITKLHKETS